VLCSPGAGPRRSTQTRASRPVQLEAGERAPPESHLVAVAWPVQVDRRNIARAGALSGKPGLHRLNPPRVSRPVQLEAGECAPPESHLAAVAWPVEVDRRHIARAGALRAKARTSGRVGGARLSARMSSCPLFLARLRREVTCPASWPVQPDAPYHCRGHANRPASGAES